VRTVINILFVRFVAEFNRLKKQVEENKGNLSDELKNDIEELYSICKNSSGKRNQSVLPQIEELKKTIEKREIQPPSVELISTNQKK